MKPKLRAICKNQWTLNRREFLSPFALALVSPPQILQASGRDETQYAQVTEYDYSSLSTQLTPNAEFFIRNHFLTPKLSLSSWMLQVVGGHSPLTLNYQEIVAQPSRTLIVTLECAGNKVGRGGVSTASWTGVPLGAVLERAGVSSAVKHIRLIGADKETTSLSRAPLSFVRSIPLEKALHPETMLAYQMNGAPLPVEHGYPLRAIVPGWYGMDAVKWLVRIEMLDHDDTSYFMTQRYCGLRLQTVGADQFPITRMRVKSLITFPSEGENLRPGVNILRGAAWGGENRIARVEVSTDGGNEWHVATLTEEPSQYAWVLWSYPWNVRASGLYTILVRATDSHGNSQPNSRDALRLDNYELNWVQAVHCQVR